METKPMEQAMEQQAKGHSLRSDVKLPMLMVLTVVFGVFAGPHDNGAVLMAGNLAIAMVPCLLLYMTLTLER